MSSSTRFLPVLIFTSVLVHISYGVSDGYLWNGSQPFLLDIFNYTLCDVSSCPNVIGHKYVRDVGVQLKPLFVPVGSQLQIKMTNSNLTNNETASPQLFLINEGYFQNCSSPSAPGARILPDSAVLNQEGTGSIYIISKGTGLDCLNGYRLNISFVKNNCTTSDSNHPCSSFENGRCSFTEDTKVFECSCCDDSKICKPCNQIDHSVTVMMSSTSATAATTTSTSTTAIDTSLAPMTSFPNSNSLLSKIHTILSTAFSSLNITTSSATTSANDSDADMIRITIRTKAPLGNNLTSTIDEETKVRVSAVTRVASPIPAVTKGTFQHHNCSTRAFANGMCVLDGFHWQCWCRSGFTGNCCNVRENACDSQPCQNDGLCETTSDNGYHCKCADGWAGKNCEKLAPSCDPNPCDNEARCFVDGDAVECVPEHSKGFLPTCHNLKCYNGGDCLIIKGIERCYCQRNFAGHRCEDIQILEYSFERHTGRHVYVALASLGAAFLLVAIVVILFQCHNYSCSFVSPRKRRSYNRHFDDVEETSVTLAINRNSTRYTVDDLRTVTNSNYNGAENEGYSGDPVITIAPMCPPAPQSPVISGDRCRLVTKIV